MYDVKSVRVTAEGCAKKRHVSVACFSCFGLHKYVLIIQTLAGMALLVLLCLLGDVCNLQVSAAPLNNAVKHLQSARKCFRVTSAVTLHVS